MRIKAGRPAGGADGAIAKEPLTMPASTIPFLIGFAAFFGAFIVAVGGVQIWLALPDRDKKD